MSTFECVSGLIASGISIIGALLGKNGGVYAFVCIAFIYCVIGLSERIKERGADK